jgi:allophanate hydrolase
VERLRALGVDLVEVDFEPLFEVARLLYEGPWVAERYLAVQPLIEHNPAAMDPVVAKVIGNALGKTAADAFAGQYALQHGKKEAQAVWQQVDLLMVPTAPRHPSFADVAAEPVAANAVLGTYTNFVNLLGWCALALPSGFTAGGLPSALPFGATFIAPARADAALARFGQRWQQAAQVPLGATGRPCPAQTNAQPLDAGVQAPALPWPATEPTLRVAVVGAHLSGLPLNGQLTERGAVLEKTTTTAARYRLFELPGTTPPKPGLLRVAEGGVQIAVEVWSLPLHQLGSFLALIPQPLGLGAVELEDGSHVHGFLCESVALQAARDVSPFGGWRNYLAQR